MVGGSEAIILAGGRGTRLRPLTDSLPKPLLPFMGAPYAAGLLRRLVEVGAKRATFLVGQEAEPWQPLLVLGEQVGIDVAVLTEEQPLDTAGAARRLLAAGVGDDVLVCNGDILTDLDLSELLAAHRAAGAIATIALKRVPDTRAFGVVITDPSGRVQRFVEKPEPGTVEADTINAGTYGLAPGVFDRFPGDGPLSFEREVFPKLVEAGETVLGVTSDAHWADLGTPDRYLAGHLAVLEGTCAWPAAPGMQRVGDALVHETAEIAHGAVLGRGTVISAHAVVGPGASLEHAVLHEGVSVGPGAHICRAILGHDSVVAAGATVGPDAVLAAGDLARP